MVFDHYAVPGLPEKPRLYISNGPNCDACSNATYDRPLSPCDYCADRYEQMLAVEDVFEPPEPEGLVSLVRDPAGGILLPLER